MAIIKPFSFALIAYAACGSAVCVAQSTSSPAEPSRITTQRAPIADPNAHQIKCESLVTQLQQSRSRGDVATSQSLLRSLIAELSLVSTRKGIQEKLRSDAIDAVFHTSATLNATDVFGAWVDSAARTDPALMRQIIVNLQMLPSTEKADSANLDVRVSRLQLQKLAAEAWVGVANLSSREPQEMRAMLDRLCAPWDAEAEKTLASKPPGREVSIASPGQRPPAVAQVAPQVIPPDQLCNSAPGEAWMARLPDDSRQRQALLLYQLQLASLRFDAALMTLSTLPVLAPNEQQTRIAAFLSAWTKAHASQVENATAGTNGRKVSLSITQAARTRQITKLAEIAARLRAISGGPLPPDVLVGAFVAVQGRSAIFKLGEIENVFGPAKAVDAGCLMSLATVMATTLQESTTPGAAAEVEQGYQMAEALLGDQLRKTPHPGLMQVLGVLKFDHAERSESSGIDVRTGFDRREQAFLAFEGAATAIAAEPTTIVATDGLVALYEQWFNCAMGATTPSRISGTRTPDMAQIDAIRRSLDALPKTLAVRVITKLAARLNATTRQINAPVVAAYVRSIIEVIGREQVGEDLLAMASYYKDILSEVKLVCSIDGSNRVGKEGLFGVRIALQHTKQLDRDVGGFSSIVQPTASALPTQTGGLTKKSSLRGRLNYLERLDDSLRQAAGQKLEIVSLLWADGGVTSRPIADREWQETPLAYALVRAKDPSVDAIPRMQLDLDFADQTASDSVVLPIVSSPVPIDTRTAEERPFELTEVTQTLNNRDENASEVTLEISAKGTGIIPALDHILRTDDLGDVAIQNIVDQGLSATRYNVARKRTNVETSVSGEVETERNWMLTLAVKGDSGGGSPRFRFPVAASTLVPSPMLSLKTQRYTDNNITPSVSEIELRVRGTKTSYLWFALGLAPVAAAAVVWLKRWRRRSPILRGNDVQIPQQFTPFSAAIFLKSLREDRGSTLTPELRADLEREIERLDRSFSPESAERKLTPTAEQIQTALRKWHVRTTQ